MPPAAPYGTEELDRDLCSLGVSTDTAESARDGLRSLVALVIGRPIERKHEYTPSEVASLLATLRWRATERAKTLYEEWKARAKECRAKGERQPHDVNRQERNATHWDQAAEELSAAFAFMLQDSPHRVHAAAKVERRRVLVELRALSDKWSAIEREQRGDPEFMAYGNCDDDLRALIAKLEGEP